MILDKQEEFSDSQAVTATAVSTNVIDTLLVAYPFMIDQANLTAATNSAGQTDSTRDLGIGEPMWLVVQVDEAATAGGAATTTITFESSAAAAMTSPTVHYTTSALALAALTLGATIVQIMIPSGNYLQFLGVRYTIATGPLTAGKFSAFLACNIQKNISYPAPYVVG